jgi:hypothetical protein
MIERTIEIEEQEIYDEDYQMNILKRNNIEGLLSVQGQGINEASQYKYDVTGKTSIFQHFKEQEMGADKIEDLLRQLLGTLNELDEYLLNIHALILEPKYIFFEGDKICFCYNPSKRTMLWESFHKFTEYLVQKVDYKDEQCMRMVFALHKGSMEENYSVQLLIKEALKMVNAYEVKGFDENKKVDCDLKINTIPYASNPQLSYIREETVSEKGHHKKIFGRKKKELWGNWDGVLED